MGLVGAARRRWRGEVPPADFASFPEAAARLRCTDFDVCLLLGAGRLRRARLDGVDGIERASLERTVRWRATARLWRLRTAVRAFYRPF